MRFSKLILPSVALATAGALLFPVGEADAFTTIGGNLDYTKRHFRVYNNFTNNNANSNQTPHPQFPGALGAVMAIWKGCVEWGTKHGDGTGDPHQQGTLGSGNSNFEPFFAGETNGIGNSNSNIHSLVSSCSSGVLAYCETPISNGWRIRYCGTVNWHGGPQTNISGRDLQGVACHEYGHALGLGHTNVGGSTMYPTISGSGVSARSIEWDDIAGVQFIYGTISSTKPKITSIQLGGGTVTINGSNFSPTGNEVRFTRNMTSSGNHNPILVVTGVSASGGGTQITLPIPSNADPGHIAVRRSSTSLSSVSNPWPFDPVGAGCDDQVTTYCETSPNSVGPGAVMSYSGSTSVVADDFTLFAFGLPPNQNAIFYYGENAIQVAFGNGFRCVGAGFTGIFRLPLVQSDPFGELSHKIDFDAPPASSGMGIITGGSVWKFQAWYRDPAAGGANFNLSNGLDVVFCP